MWPFRKKIKEPKTSRRKMMERVVAGVIVGAAISSIVGKKMMDKHKKEDGEE